MGVRFMPCLVCARHVKLSETACPFCGAPRSPVSEREPPPLRRRSRAALFAAGAVAAIVPVTACGGQTESSAQTASTSGGTTSTSEIGTMPSSTSTYASTTVLMIASYGTTTLQYTVELDASGEAGPTDAAGDSTTDAIAPDSASGEDGSDAQSDALTIMASYGAVAPPVEGGEPG
jgi:hypothetical protein